MLFGINQPIELVSASKHRPNARLMRPNPSSQIARYAKIQRSVRSVGHDVDPTGGHGQDGIRGWLRKRLRKYALTILLRIKSWVAGPSPAMTQI
jgi:hypothetical protein